MLKFAGGFVGLVAGRMTVSLNEMETKSSSL